MAESSQLADEPALPGSRLYEQAKRLQAKKEVLARLLPEECTFRPEVNRRGAAAAPDAGDGDGVPERAFDRLHKLAASRAESHDRAARELGPDFTFSPAATLTKAARKLKADASASPSSAGHGLYERALASRAALETRAKQLADAEYTFEPKITAKARRLKREGTAVDRLYDPTAIQRRNDVNHNDPSAALLADVPSPFVPKVNKPRASATPATPGDADSGATNAFDRLYRRARERDANIEERRLSRLATEMVSCPFSPSLNAPRPSTAPAASAAAADGSGSAPAQSTFSRLYNDALDRRLRTETFASAAPPEDAECTFEPSLTVTSRRISERLRSPQNGSGGAGSAAADLLPRHLQLYAEGLKKQRDKREHADLITQAGGLVRVEEARECTFQPRVGRSPGGPASASVPVHDRLYEEALAKRAAIIAIEAGLEE